MNARVSGLVLLCIPLAIECFLNRPSVCLLDLGQKGIANRFSVPSVFPMSEKTVLLPKQTSKLVLEQQCLLKLFTKEVRAQLSSPENGSGWDRSCRWCSFGPPFCGQPKHLPENMLWSMYRFIAGNCPHCSKWIDPWCCHYLVTVRNLLPLQCSVTRSPRVWLPLFCLTISEGWGFLHSPVNF